MNVSESVIVSIFIRCPFLPVVEMTHSEGGAVSLPQQSESQEFWSHGVSLLLSLWLYLRTILCRKCVFALILSIFWLKKSVIVKSSSSSVIRVFFKELNKWIKDFTVSCSLLFLKFNLAFSLLSQNSTPTLWDSLEEPDIRDTSEFEYLFSKDTPQQKKKPLSESYEKKNKIKKVLTDYSNLCNYIYIYIYIFVIHGNLLCAAGLLSLCFQKVFWKVLSHRWQKGANSWRNLCLLFWSCCLNFQTVLFIWTFFSH